MRLTAVHYAATLPAPVGLCQPAEERGNIYEIMSKPVIYVDPEMDIRYCTRLFENFGLARAPVVENKKVVGIIGYTDIVLNGVRDRLL